MLSYILILGTLGLGLAAWINLDGRLKTFAPLVSCFQKEKKELAEVAESLCNHTMWETREAKMKDIYKQSNEALLSIVKDEIDKVRRVCIKLEEQVVKRSDEYKYQKSSF
jgi:hypothetical protein